MSAENPKVPRPADQTLDPSRRTFMTIAALAGAGSAVGFGTQTSSAATLASGSPVPGAPQTRRPVVTMLVYDGMIMQDLVGPLTVLNLLPAEIHLVGRTTKPVSTDVALPVTPTSTYRHAPHHPDILFVPGGLDGTVSAMLDRATVEFVARAGRRAKWVTSVCTGALLLGAAGLLCDYRATTHWYVRDLLTEFGATPSDERVVRDRNRVTGGGVTSGIDFGLVLASLLRDEETARRIQLLIEYAPAPPFDSGTPATAAPELTAAVLKARAPSIQKARDIAERSRPCGRPH